MTRARRKHFNGGLRVGAIVVLLTLIIFVVPSSQRVTPRPGARFEDVAHRIAIATERAMEATPHFVPTDFPPWQARSGEDLPALLRRVDRFPPDGRIWVASADAPIEAHPVPARGEALESFLADVTEPIDIAVWPCRGAPRMFSAAEVVETSERYLLVPRGADIALFDSRAGSVLLESVAAVVITVGARKVAAIP